MAIQIFTHRLSPDSVVLLPQGEIDALTSPLLKEAILDLLEGGTHTIILNLRRVDFLDSTGLGILLGGLRRINEAGGVLALCELSPRLVRLFQLTCLDTVMDVYETEAEAIAALIPSAPV